MIQIKHDFQLKSFNTFGFDITAGEYIACHNNTEVAKALAYVQQQNKPFLVLGGGSNILFSQNFEGTIIHPIMNNITKVRENEEYIWLEASAGVVWDDLVAYCVDRNWYGLENLSYIPGNVGASPVQNIGAYGVEVKDCIESVKGYYIADGHPFEMSNADCHFAYRQSIFKGELKNKTLITSVIFKLNKSASFHLSYGPVKEQVQKNGRLTLSNVRNTIIDIRRSKLPEPEELGNAGSFFKNPVINCEAFSTLQEQHGDVPHYPLDNSMVKVPAGWLIEKAGWKGKSMGRAAVHTQQALVLVNKGGATGYEVLHLAQQIIQDVQAMFGISIEPEVNIL
ncbi:MULTISPECIES: UDP-N-acetylmuramate dehydrogenase [unclassified Carboxylicivirga]|uniref:UDP-N-acetylmuramate dehydrogenase n=1 Tax=Carboxylicivirga TaxID=1628153 RepID=UPI003D341177